MGSNIVPTYLGIIYFCNTSLPLTSTRWLNQHIQAFPFPHSKKCRWLISATSRMNHSSEKNSSEKLLVMPRIKPGAAGSEAGTLPLCYVASPIRGSSLIKMLFLRPNKNIELISKVSVYKHNFTTTCAKYFFT